MANGPNFKKFNTASNSKQRNSLSNSFLQNNDYNPIIILTVILSAISWVIAFAGSIAASQSMTYFPKFTWWGLIFELFVVILLPILYFLDIIYFYRDFLLAAISISFIYTTNSANNLIYYTISSASAASAGFVLLSIINFLWLFYIGSSPNAPLISQINKYGYPHLTLNPSAQSNRNTRSFYQNNRSTNDFMSNEMDINNINTDKNMHELSGFENPALPTPNNFDSEYDDSAYRASGINPMFASSNNLNNTPQDGNNNLANNLVPAHPPVINPNTGTGFTMGTNFTGITSATEYMDDYPILVRGLYNYNANPDDVNELSFSKGEIFRVKNTDGNWWQGKTKRGDIGMCPSNYLEVVN